MGLGILASLSLCFLMFFVQIATAAQQAATAADLSALAAADAARGLSSGEPCEVAARTASEQHAQLVDCQLQGDLSDIVEVRTAVPLPGLLGALFGQSTGQARAGPPQEAAKT